MENPLLRKYANLKRTTKLRKGHLDLRFLLECKENNLIPKVLQFKLAYRHLHNSVVYRKCQIKLLEEEIRTKREKINILEKDTKRIREELQGPFLVQIFHISHKSTEYLEFLLPLLFQDVKQKNLSSEDLPLMKARLLDTVLSSHQSFSSDQSSSENLTVSEFKALRHLSKKKNCHPESR